MTDVPPAATTTAGIPVAAIEAAAKAVAIMDGEAVCDCYSVARTALAAALPHLTPPPRPGEMHPVDRAFYDLAIKERDSYKELYFRLRDQLKEGAR